MFALPPQLKIGGAEGLHYAWGYRWQGESMTTSGQKLRELRLQRGMSLWDLSILSQVSASAIYSIERFNQSYVTARVRNSLAEALQVNPCQIWENHERMVPIRLPSRRQATLLLRRDSKPV